MASPMYLVLYILDNIDDLCEDNIDMIIKFAEDTKVGVVVDSEEVCLGLQWDIDQLRKWIEEWHMEFYSNSLWSDALC